MVASVDALVSSICVLVVHIWSAFASIGGPLDEGPNQCHHRPSWCGPAFHLPKSIGGGGQPNAKHRVASLQPEGGSDGCAEEGLHFSCEQSPQGKANEEPAHAGHQSDRAPFSRDVLPPVWIEIQVEIVIGGVRPEEFLEPEVRARQKAAGGSAQHHGMPL